jgi:hypothetical protein
MKLKKDRGFVLVLAMLIVVVVGTFAVAMLSMCNTNLQLAKNQHKANMAMSAALSGVEYGRFVCSTYESGLNTAGTISSSQKNAVWQGLRSFAHDHPCNGHCAHCRDGVKNSKIFEEFSIPAKSYGAENFTFTVSFTLYADDPNTIIMESTGSDGVVSKKITMSVKISKDNRILKYAIASKGRIWITSATTIDGDIFSTWDATRYGSAGIETTVNVTNKGTLSTVNTIADMDSVNVQMETLDANGNPMFDINGNRVYSSNDTVQGYHDGIKYGQSSADLPGMSEDDYDTSSYKTMCSTNKIAASTEKTTEYFPHYDGNYSRSVSGSVSFSRNVYRNKAYTNVTLPKGRNALFVNCTFNGVTYIESTSNTTSTSSCNNVRFDDCKFNGVIVTDVPKNGSNINWRQNSLYFTGGAIFENSWSEQEATILAPNFNVNLGNTTELEADQTSELTGAVVGGIVDIRGIVNIDGTIISMYDTKMYSSGYVTNIGSTDDDGGSEGGAFSGEEINISPSQAQILPQGLKANIVVCPEVQTYKEN